MQRCKAQFRVRRHSSALSLSALPRLLASGTGAHPCGAARSRRARRSLGTFPGHGTPRAARALRLGLAPGSRRAFANAHLTGALGVARLRLAPGRGASWRPSERGSYGSAGRTRRTGDRRERRGRAGPRLAGSPGRLLVSLAPPRPPFAPRRRTRSGTEPSGGGYATAKVFHRLAAMASWPGTLRFTRSRTVR